MAKKKITIEDIGRNINRLDKAVESLAIITKKGFDAVDKKFVEVKTEMDKRFAQVDQRFNKIDDRLDRTENLLIRAHENRIERLGDKVLKIETVIGK